LFINGNRRLVAAFFDQSTGVDMHGSMARWAAQLGVIGVMLAIFLFAVWMNVAH
jgi:hypothetical protein